MIMEKKVVSAAHNGNVTFDSKCACFFCACYKQNFNLDNHLTQRLVLHLKKKNSTTYIIKKQQRFSDYLKSKF